MKKEMTRQNENERQCCRCKENFDIEKNQISKHPFERKFFYCNKCLIISLKNKQYNTLRNLSDILNKLNDLKVINTLSIQKYDMNANYNYTFISFKVDNLHIM